MSENKYLQWLSNNTKTSWWADTANPTEILESMKSGAVGVTTNPLLIKLSLFSNPEIWAPMLSSIPKSLKGAEKAEAILEKITGHIAGFLLPTFEKTKGQQGYVCAQVNPRKPGDAEFMVNMARRLNKWAPNIAIKLPVTAAGLDALEECVAEGMTITATASFTVPQALAIGDRHMKGLERARKAGKPVGKCFAVLMVGRLDDYLRDIAMDRKSNVLESDIIQAGTATAKRAYEMFNKNKYEAIIMPAGMRGAYHTGELAGANMVLSIHPKIQALVAKIEKPWKENIDIPIEKDVIQRLQTISEFVRAYEPDGMKPIDFITYGTTQKTLSQFVEAGWMPIESYEL